MDNEKIGMNSETAAERTGKAGKPVKKNRSAAGRVTGAISTVLVVIVVLMAVLLVGSRIVGLKPFTVLSGSMEPTYHTGALIYVKSVDPLTVSAGQPITFMLDEHTVVTHRVVEVFPDAEDPDVVRFMTQGDANEKPDAVPVHSKNVIGVPVFTIPYLGYVANYIQNPPGRYLAIAAIVIIILLAFVPDIFDDNRKGKTRKEVVSDNTAEDSAQPSAPESAGPSAGKDTAE